MNDLDRTKLLEAYKDGPPALQQALSSFPNEMWDFKSASDSWSIHEIVVHLADTEVQSHVRFRTIISEPSTTGQATGSISLGAVRWSTCC